MQDPIVSVVIPCFNGGEYIDACIRSVLEQNLNSEIILVDDGSNDDSVPRAIALTRDLAPGSMLVISQANQGPGVARNTGLRAARGRYICFLDVDDQYAPGFFAAALPVLERDPGASAVACGIEFLNLHRPIEPWHREAMEASGPGNLIARTEIVRQIGGFPTDPAFRGKASGEDSCFRRALLRYGKVPKLDQPFFRYLVRQGSHFDFFLDRATFEDGRVTLKHQTREELDGSAQRAVAEYVDQVTSRALSRFLEKMHGAIGAGDDFLRHAGACQRLPGTLSPMEGFALYWLARGWPPDGRVVELDSVQPRSTCWLAAGCKDARRGKVLSVTTDAAILNHGLAATGLADSVIVHAADPQGVGSAWQDPIRTLTLDGGLSTDAIEQLLPIWSRSVIRHGVIVLPTPRARPELAKLINQLLQDPQQWKPIMSIGGLAIIEKLS